MWSIGALIVERELALNEERIDIEPEWVKMLLFDDGRQVIEGIDQLVTALKVHRESR